ncbi:MAG: hypothetical protein ACT4QA_07105 [Panacagrimonas sp.]
MAVADAAQATPRLRHRPRWLPIAATAASFVLSVSLLIDLWRQPETRMSEASMSMPVSEAEFSVMNSFPVGAAHEAAAAPEPQLVRPAPDARQAHRSNDQADSSAKSIADQKKRRAEAEGRVLSPPPEKPESGLEFTRQLRSQSAPLIPLIAPAPQTDAEAAAPAEPTAGLHRDSEAAKDALPHREPAQAPDALRFLSGEALSSKRSAEAGAPEFAPGSTDAAMPVEALSNPDAWIERIRELNRRGAADAVRREITRFREKYPQYELPSDLSVFTPVAPAPVATEKSDTARDP